MAARSAVVLARSGRPPAAAPPAAELVAAVLVAALLEMALLVAVLLDPVCSVTALLQRPATAERTGKARTL
jgi:hypothetical protein